MPQTFKALLNTGTQVTIIPSLLGRRAEIARGKESNMNLWMGPLGQLSVLLLHLHLNVQEELICYMLVLPHPIGSSPDLDKPLLRKIFLPFDSNEWVRIYHKCLYPLISKLFTK